MDDLGALLGAQKYQNDAILQLIAIEQRLVAAVLRFATEFAMRGKHLRTNKFEIANVARSKFICC